MPNTKSAERRVRNSQRKRLHNRSISGAVKRAEKNLHSLIAAGKKDEAAAALREVASRYDKAVKSGVIRRGTANRKKSRLSLSLNAAAAK